MFPACTFACSYLMHLFFQGNNSQGRLGRRSPGSSACVGRTGITGAVGEDLRALAASVGGGGRPGIAQQVRGEVACVGPGCSRSPRCYPLAINPVPKGCSVVLAKPPSSREASQAWDGEPSAGRWGLLAEQEFRLKAKRPRWSKALPWEHWCKSPQSSAAGTFPPGMVQPSPNPACRAAPGLLTGCCGFPSVPQPGSLPRITGSLMAPACR